MPSPLISFLQKQLPKYWRKRWNPETMPIVSTTTTHHKFWVVDDKHCPFRDNDRDGGVAINNSRQHGHLEIVHFEDFVDKLMKGNNKITKCDCIIAHKYSFHTIVFVELKDYHEKYLDVGRQNAYEQLEKSISACRDAGDLLYDFQRCIALFAYRLREVPMQVDVRNPMARIKRNVVAKQTKILGHVRYIGRLPLGFELHECCAPASFAI